MNEAKGTASQTQTETRAHAATRPAPRESGISLMNTDGERVGRESSLCRRCLRRAASNDRRVLEALGRKAAE
jgi:hypothetical protein